MGASNSRRFTSAQVYAALKANNWNRTDAAASLKCPRATFIHYVRVAIEEGYSVPNNPGIMNQTMRVADTHETETLRGSVRDLTKQLKELRAGALTEGRAAEILGAIARTPYSPPGWILPPSGADVKNLNHISGVPTLFASDWHFSEVVRAAEIGGVNSYNMNIARARARQMISVTVRLLKDYIAKPAYPGIVFALGGDMISGDIHEELAQTNEVESIPAVLEILEVLIWCIDQLRAQFNNVFIPCVTGNHGRTSKKPRAKRRNHTNYDWIIYKLLERHYAAEPHVTFLIPEGSDALYRVYSHRYLLTHGDQFRGGDGMIGMLGPVLRGDLRKRTRQTQVNQSYDTMIMGHWHQLTQLPRVIVNGSLKGYDEYAAQGNLTFEQPAQALWITHPQHGITFSMPVYVDRAKNKESTSWVSVSSN